MFNVRSVVLFMIAYLWNLPWRLSGEYAARWAIRDLRGKPVANWESQDGFAVLQAGISGANARADLGTTRAMTATLGAYGKVMLAHYKPDNGSQSTFDADVRAVLSDDYLRDVQRLGLFAMSFMDGVNLDASDATFGFVAEALRRHGV